MKKTGIVTGIIFMFLFSISVQSADQCMGDLDCSGVVDGLDLALFAADYGRPDCPGGPSVVLGWVNFEKKWTVDYYEMSLSLSENLEKRELRLTLKEGGSLMGEINMKAITGGTFSLIGVFFAGEELLKLQTVAVKSVRYIPPVRSGDVYLVEIALRPSSISMGSSYDSCPFEFNFLQEVGYTGSAPLPDYIPVSNFSFAMTSGNPLPEFYSIWIEYDLNEHIGCYLRFLDTGSHIDKVLIEKWGSARDDGPESRIMLAGIAGHYVKIDGVSLYSTPSKGIEQGISFFYSRITWIHGELVDGSWQTYETCWDLIFNTPCY